MRALIFQHSSASAPPPNRTPLTNFNMLVETLDSVLATL